MERKVFCMSCGTELPVHARFCMNCGERVPEEETQAVSVPSKPARNESCAGITLEDFRKIVRENGSQRETFLAYRKELKEQRWDYNAVAGILIGSDKRHVSGPIHELEQNIGIGQGDNGNHVEAKLREKGLEEVYARYEKNGGADLTAVEQEILKAAPEYEAILELIHTSLLNGGKPQRSGDEDAAGKVIAVKMAEKTQEKMEKKAPEETLGKTLERILERMAKTPEKAAENTPEKMAGKAPEKISEKTPVKPIAGLAKGENRGVIELIIEVFRTVIDGEMGESRQKRTAEYNSLAASLRKVLLDEYGIEDPNDLSEELWQEIMGASEESAAGLKTWVVNGAYGIGRAWGMYGLGMDHMISVLSLLIKKGYGSASYVMGRIYGRRILTDRGAFDDKSAPFYSKPDSGRMIRCFTEAANAKYPSGAAMTALGCFYMTSHDKKSAELYLSQAVKYGEADAKIYLDHLDRLMDSAVQPQSYCLFGDQGGAGTAYMRANCIEHQGYLYLMGPSADRVSQSEFRKNEDKLQIARIDLNNGRMERLAEVSGEVFRNSSCIDIKGTPCFSICGRYLYYTDGYRIIRMDLDGSNQQVMDGFEKSGQTRYTMLLVFPACMYYQKASGDLFRYDFSSGTSSKLCQAKNITSISENEVILDNEKVVNSVTREKAKLDKVYPGTKKKNVILVDSAKEIAYCLDSSDDGYYNQKIIGTDKKGNVVDIWHMPCISTEQYEYLTKGGGSSTMCFDGGQISIKFGCVSAGQLYKERLGRLNLDFDIPAFISRYDRSGNELLLCENINSLSGVKYPRFGSFHCMTNNTICFLGINERGKCWALYLSADQKVSEIEFFY